MNESSGYKYDINDLHFRKIRADEVDLRIAQLRPNGLQLLLYKDARVDMNILDETVGPMNWTRSHSRENKNCTIGIWDYNKGIFVTKEDTGVESFTEKEKGLASDSFKRCGFNWGIGRELYTAPFIWIPADKCHITKNDQNKLVCRDVFTVNTLETDELGKISKLTIKRGRYRLENGTVDPETIVYSFVAAKTNNSQSQTVKKEEAKPAQEEKKEAPANKPGQAPVNKPEQTAAPQTVQKTEAPANAPAATTDNAASKGDANVTPDAGFTLRPTRVSKSDATESKKPREIKTSYDAAGTEEGAKAETKPAAAPAEEKKPVEVPAEKPVAQQTAQKSAEEAKPQETRVNSDVTLKELGATKIAIAGYKLNPKTIDEIYVENPKFLKDIAAFPQVNAAFEQVWKAIREYLAIKEGGKAA